VANIDRDELRAVQAPLKERYREVLQTLASAPALETTVSRR
jgi:hypothetical protein